MGSNDLARSHLIMTSSKQHQGWPLLDMPSLMTGPASLGSPPVTPGLHEQPTSRRYNADATILLVGFVGAGKKTLGLIASIALRRKLIDYDAFFHSQVNSSPQNFIATYGFARYREVETE